MKLKKVKQSVIISIALLVAILLTLPRVLSLFNVVQQLTDSFTTPSLLDILFRFLFSIFIFWVFLQYNTNLRFFFSAYSTVKRNLIAIVVNSSFFTISIPLFHYLYPFFSRQDMLRAEEGLIHFVNLIVILILIFISSVLRYQIIHKQDLIENHKLKQEKIQSELLALKNQINPHFLFNSLNSLSSLVRDNKKATTFIGKLSFMYRYILQSGARDTVTLREELQFLESYVHLIKTRYQDRFSINITIEEQWLNNEIPTLALQLLVENAVKHNEISKEKPLKVSIFNTEDYLVIENKMQSRRTYVDSTGNGLVNLSRRYDLLQGKRIVITSNATIFRVKLPLS